jgi:hypothetical protein
VRQGQDERHTRAPIALLAATVVLAVLGLALMGAAWPHFATADSYSSIGLFIGAVVYAWLGTIVLRRTRNTIGWILLGEGIGLTLSGALSALAVLGAAHPGRVPGWDVMGLLAELVFIPVIIGLSLMLLLFPTGDIPSPRWRVVELIMLVASMLVLVATALTPTQVVLPAPGGVSLEYPNPLGMSFLRGTFIGTNPGLGAISVPLFVACVVALVERYRSGQAELRQQIKWLALVAGAFAVSQVVLTVALLALGSDSPFTLGVGFLSGNLALFGFPIAITLAILRYGLYEIDLILNRAVVYSLLAAGVTVVYVAIVAGVGTLVGSRGGPLLTIAAAIAIALLFQPLRRRAQRLANRVVYGERATPYQVLSEFADAMARTVPLEEQLDEMVSLLASGTGATAIEVWITVGRSLRAIAVWPAGAPVPEPRATPDAGGLEEFPDATAVFPVRQADEVLGEIVLYKPRNEPLSPTEATLAEHVASQAGLVVRNVRLTEELRNTIEELRASRRRLVAAQDLERRKIERNPPRWGPAAARRPRCAAEPARAARPQRAGRRAAHQHDPPAAGDADRRPGRPPGSRARDLPTVARRPGPCGGARRAGSEGRGPDQRGRGWGRSVRPRGGSDRLLLHPRSAAERREVRGRHHGDGPTRGDRRVAHVPGRG